MWRTYCCLKGFFPIVDTCLSCEDIARQSCAIVPRWRIFGDFLWSPYGIGQSIIFLSCFFYLSLFFSLLNLNRRRLDANLECRTETCCTWLAGNAGPKKLPKMRHLGTIAVAQLYRAISSQLRHISTIGKKTCYLLNSNMSSRCPHNLVNFGLLAAEICWQV